MFNLLLWRRMSIGVYPENYDYHANCTRTSLQPKCKCEFSVPLPAVSAVVVPSLSKIAENATISMLLLRTKRSGNKICFQTTEARCFPTTAKRCKMSPDLTPPLTEAQNILQVMPDLYSKVLDALIVGELVRELYKFSANYQLCIEDMATYDFGKYSAQDFWGTSFDQVTHWINLLVKRTNQNMVYPARRYECVGGVIPAYQTHISNFYFLLLFCYFLLLFCYFLLLFCYSHFLATNLSELIKRVLSFQYNSSCSSPHICGLKILHWIRSVSYRQRARLVGGEQAHFCSTTFW